MNETPETIETELKLILPGTKAESTITDFLRQNNYILEDVEPVENTDIYMDTLDWSLLKNKLSLRYRLSNGKAMYTLKSVGDIKDGIARRMENEIVLEDAPHDPTDIPVKTLRSQIRDVIYPRKLMEQILIHTNRWKYMAVSPEGTKLELDFDVSSFSANALFKPRHAPKLYEFEAEVLEGPETALIALASLLSSNFKYPPSKLSKMESAMARLKVKPLTKTVPEKLKVKIDDRLDIALKKILEVEFNWFQEQLPGVLNDRDPEFVHQARVATRRMRSALVLFHDALPVKTVTYLEERLKWLGKLFGEVRNLDVFVINLNGYKEKIGKYPKEKRKALETLVVKQRRAPLKSLGEALKSRRYKALERQMTRLFVTTPKEAESPASGRLISEVAPQLIIQKLENIIEQSQKTMANPELKEYHSLRIQMKRLRYALEFMAAPYGDVFNDVIKQTTDIQDCLGELQDTVFNQKFIRDIFKNWKGKLTDPELIFILGEIYQLQGETSRERQESFSTIWGCFAPEKTIQSLKEFFQQQPENITA
jgi:triphosphatase